MQKDGFNKEQQKAVKQRIKNCRYFNISTPTVYSLRRELLLWPSGKTPVLRLVDLGLKPAFPVELFQGQVIPVVTLGLVGQVSVH